MGGGGDVLKVLCITEALHYITQVKLLLMTVTVS